MPKFLEVTLQVSLNDAQAAIIGDLTNFSEQEFHLLIGEAIRHSYTHEATENIQVKAAIVVEKPDSGFVMPENKILESSYWRDPQI